MTKDEIKKALEFCAQDNYYFCGGCSYDDVRNCNDKLKTDALNVIIEQEREIERLKAENDTNMQYIRMMGIQSHIKTSNEQVKQAKIDVLNKFKQKYGFYSCYAWSSVVKSLTEIIDEFIKEVENE